MKYLLMSAPAVTSSRLRNVAAAAGPTHVDVAGHDGHVLEVQRGVDLVHEVERRGLVVVQREHQRQRAERLLSSGKVEDLLPALLGRPHAVGRENPDHRSAETRAGLDRITERSRVLVPEHDALGERVQAVHQLQLGVAA